MTVGPLRVQKDSEPQILDLEILRVVLTLLGIYLTLSTEDSDSPRFVLHLLFVRCRGCKDKGLSVQRHGLGSVRLSLKGTYLRL